VGEKAEETRGLVWWKPAGNEKKHDFKGKQEHGFAKEMKRKEGVKDVVGKNIKF